MCRKVLLLYVFVLTLLDKSLNKLSVFGKNDGLLHESLMTDGIHVEESMLNGGGGRGGGGGGEPAAGVRISPRSVEFGRVPLGQAHTATVTVTNLRNHTLHLTSITGTSTDFHASFFDNKVVEPGGSSQFVLVFVGRWVGGSWGRVSIADVGEVTASAAGTWGGAWTAPTVSVPAGRPVSVPLTLSNYDEDSLRVLSLTSSAGGLTPAAVSDWVLPRYSTRTIGWVRVSGGSHVRVWTSAGVLVVPVRTQPGAALYAAPPAAALGYRGTRDPPLTHPLHIGSWSPVGVPLSVSTPPARCAPLPLRLAPRAPSPAAPPHATLLNHTVLPLAPPAHLADLTFNFSAMLSGVDVSWDEPGWDGAVVCEGEVVVSHLVLHYGVVLLPGTLALRPQQLLVVTSEGDAGRARGVTITNEFSLPLLITGITYPDDFTDHFIISEMRSELVLPPGGSAALPAVSLRPHRPQPLYSANITVSTNVSDYILPVHVYTGELDVEWWWPPGRVSRGSLDMGVVPRRPLQVSGRAANPGGGPVCYDHHCVPPGGSVPVSVMLEGAAGRQTSHVRVGPAHVSVTALLVDGDLHLSLSTADQCAPYLWCWWVVSVESTLPQPVEVVSLRTSAGELVAPPPPALHPGRWEGDLLLRPEDLCHPHCYLGVPYNTTEHAEWYSRLASSSLDVEAERAEVRRRHELFNKWRGGEVRVTLSTGAGLWTAAAPLHLTRGTVLLRCGVNSGSTRVESERVINVTVSNPASVDVMYHVTLSNATWDASAPCRVCTGRPGAGDEFSLRGPAQFTLPPGTTREVEIRYRPMDAAHHSTYLYVRNNLTVAEVVSVCGRGVHPTFKVNGRKLPPNTSILLEVSECDARGVGEAAAEVHVLGDSSPLHVLGEGFRVHGNKVVYRADWTRAWSRGWVVSAAGARGELRGAAVRSPRCDAALNARSGPAAVVALLALTVLVLASIDADRILNRPKRAVRAPGGQPLDLRSLNHANTASVSSHTDTPADHVTHVNTVSAAVSTRQRRKVSKRQEPAPRVVVRDTSAAPESPPPPDRAPQETQQPRQEDLPEEELRGGGVGDEEEEGERGQHSADEEGGSEEEEAASGEEEHEDIQDEEYVPPTAPPVPAPVVVAAPPAPPAPPAPATAAAVPAPPPPRPWGASFSAVVAGATHSTDSLFYFNDDYYWGRREHAPPPPPPHPHPPATAPPESAVAEEGGGGEFGAVGSVWGNWGTWESPWGGAAPVSPPPGFPPRPFDPFHALADIWAPPPWTDDRNNQTPPRQQ